MAKENKECPYLVKVCGVPICQLNACPCERISDGICERIYEAIMPKGGSGIAGEGDTEYGD